MDDEFKKVVVEALRELLSAVENGYTDPNRVKEIKDKLTKISEGD